MDPNQPNHGLPQKPPGVARNTSNFRPAFGFTPRSVARNIQGSTNAASYRGPAYPSTSSAGPQYNSPYGANTASPGPYSQQAYGGGYGQGYDNSYGQYRQDTAGPPSYHSGYQTGSSKTHSGSHGHATDEDAQQYLQWQSAYTGNATESPNPSSNNTLPTSSATTGAHSTKVDPRIDSQQGANETHNKTHDGKPKSRLEELQDEGWVKDQWRLFVGNLAGEVTDDTLLKAFAAFPSVSKVKVIRDKATTKSKGYGFVQFANADDFLKAGREMQNKYIGSHPVKISKANADFFQEEKDKPKVKHPLFRDKEEIRKKKRNKNKNRQNQEKEEYGEPGNGMTTSAGAVSYGASAEHYEHKVLHANTHGGVQKNKKGQKTRDGLNMLG